MKIKSYSDENNNFLASDKSVNSWYQMKRQKSLGIR